MSPRGVLWDTAGVGNFSSAGREDVNVHDLGRSVRELPVDLPFVVDIWEAI